MIREYQIPILPRIAGMHPRSELNPDGGGWERVYIRPDDAVIDRLVKMVLLPIRNRGDRAELLILGWRTYFTVALWWTNHNNADDLLEPGDFYGAKLVLDPSRENYAKVIESRRHMKHCPVIEWVP